MPPPRCNTVLVEHIPPEHCSDSGLVAYFNSVFGREVVESAHVTRTLRSEVLREMDGNGLPAEEVQKVQGQNGQQKSINMINLTSAASCNHRIRVSTSNPFSLPAYFPSALAFLPSPSGIHVPYVGTWRWSARLKINCTKPKVLSRSMANGLGPSSHTAR